MSRTSDTRQRTREAAANLVAGGIRPHAVTVDLIYAAIQQGSRTTINDELKRWKDDRTKIDALGAELPPPVADAMRGVWLAAVENGEQVFEQRRAALEQQLAAVEAEKAEATAAHQAAERTIHDLRLRLDVTDRRGAELEQRLVSETQAKDAAQAKTLDLTEQLALARTDHATALEQQRLAHEQQVVQHRNLLADREASFRNEIARVTERLEGVQNHMLRQISDAREAQKRAEAEQQAARQRAEQLQKDLADQRMEYAIHRRQLDEKTHALESKTSETRALMEQKDVLQVELANTRGQLQALNGQLAGFREQAVSAQYQMAKLLEERFPKPTEGS